MSDDSVTDGKFARRAWLRALERTAPIGREPLLTLPVLVARIAAGAGGATAIESPEATLGYAELAARCNRYSRWAGAQGLRAGDVVALFATNSAEYLPVWLGLTRVGVVVALVNSHLAGAPLVHCLRIVRPRVVIASADLAATLQAVHDQLGAGVALRTLGDSPSPIAALGPELASLPGGALDAGEAHAPSLDDTALYIYTSGTTGLPKAATVSHHRVMQWSLWFSGLLDTTSADRMYDCLPLYHSVGGVVATGATLAGGGTVVVRPRFSASGFWRDVHDSRCTLFQYIGELCRYLVNAPAGPFDTAHRLRIACGNGLRPEIWEAFRTRFAIPRIVEYYASTEGNFSLYNCEGQPGSIGRIPPFLGARLPVRLVRFDVERGEPLRNALGRCEPCEPGEAGEAIGQIPADSVQRAGRFEGYADADATARKILRDVFEAGDAWYRTGDLMRCDARGFFYFVDRVGDTYRWKGENVSTAEVMSAVSTAPGVRDGVVYGVAVPGSDGRAGMAALVVDERFDVSAFHRHVTQFLPGYAVPVFLRLVRGLAATGTFKPLKSELTREGFDPALVRDPLYVADGARAQYVTLDRAAFDAVAAGRMRL